MPEVGVEVSRHLKKVGWSGDGRLNLRCRGGVHPGHALFAPNGVGVLPNSITGAAYY